MNKNDLTIVKMRLYHALLLKPADELTDNEIELGYLLAQDKDIQALLTKSFTKKD